MKAFVIITALFLMYVFGLFMGIQYGREQMKDVVDLGEIRVPIGRIQSANNSIDFDQEAGEGWDKEDKVPIEPSPPCSVESWGR